VWYIFVNFIGFRIPIRIANADTDAGGHINAYPCGSVSGTLVLILVSAI
jgi:hypothetical protein